MVVVQHLNSSLKTLQFFSVIILYFFSSRILCDLQRCIENGSRGHRWWGISIGSAIMAPKCQIHDHFGSNINDPFLSRKDIQHFDVKKSTTLLDEYSYHCLQKWVVTFSPNWSLCPCQIKTEQVFQRWQKIHQLAKNPPQQTTQRATAMNLFL